MGTKRLHSEIPLAFRKVPILLVLVMVISYTTEASGYGSHAIPTNEDTISETRETLIRSFQWRYVDRTMTTRECQLLLELPEAELYKALEFMEFIGDMSPEDLGLDIEVNERRPDVFQWQLWGAIFRRLYNQAYDRLDIVVDSLKSAFNAAELSQQNQVLFVQTFVQNLEYKRPGGTFDLLPPMVALDRQFGDCDTKSLLLYILYEKLGIDCVLLWSYKYHHTMLGLSGGKVGKYKTYKGKRFYFLETTYPGWDIGELPPKTKRESFWHILDLDTEYQEFSSY